MHNKVSCLPPRLLHRVHCRRTSLHFAAPSRVVVLVPVARRDPAHQSRVVIIPPVRRASSFARSLGVVILFVSRVWSSFQPPVLWASSSCSSVPCGRHPARRQGVVVPPVRWASSSCRSWAACPVCCCLDVVFPAACSSMLSVAHLLFAVVLWNCSEGARSRRSQK
jgi:hypothetical protein